MSNYKTNSFKFICVVIKLYDHVLSLHIVNQLRKPLLVAAFTTKIMGTSSDQIDHSYSGPSQRRLQKSNFTSTLCVSQGTWHTLTFIKIVDYYDTLRLLIKPFLGDSHAFLLLHITWYNQRTTSTYI